MGTVKAPQRHQAPKVLTERNPRIVHRTRAPQALAGLWAMRGVRGLADRRRTDRAASVASRASRPTPMGLSILQQVTENQMRRYG